MMIDKETIQRLVDSRISAHYMNTVGEQGRMQNRITKLEDKGVEKVIVETIGPMLERLTALEERNIGYKQDIVLLTQENSQMFERITALENWKEKQEQLMKQTHFTVKEPAEPAMEEWIEVDGKMYGTSAAPDHIEDDLVERLRGDYCPDWTKAMLPEIADRIEADGREIARLGREIELLEQG